jgi:hypothetical protein
MDGRTGTIVRCVSGFWVVRFDQPIEIVPGSYAEVLKYGREIEREPLPGMWLLKMADVGGLRTMPIINAEKAAVHFADRTPEHGGRLDWSGLAASLDGDAADRGGLSELATVSRFPTSIGLKGSGNGKHTRSVSSATDSALNQSLLK